MQEGALPDYGALDEFRFQIRHFLQASAGIAREAGLDAQQHQLLLTVKGAAAAGPVLVGTIAERLQIRHQSAVELVDRCVRNGLVCRHRDGEDRRRVLVGLTAHGEEMLDKLTVHHVAELRTSGPALVRSLDAVLRHAGRRRSTLQSRASKRHDSQNPQDRPLARAQEGSTSNN